MEPIDYWRLCDELTVFQAALLIAGKDPSGEFADVERWKPQDRPPGYDAARSGISNALKNGVLKGSVRPLAQSDAHGGAAQNPEDSIDIENSMVDVFSLRGWLFERGVTKGFLFPEESDIPVYLNPGNSRYAPKLAAAVNAWLALSDGAQIRGKTPKQALIRWLRENASRFKLSDEEGKPNEQGIEECAKVANWQDRGGAPRTPSTLFWPMKPARHLLILGQAARMSRLTATITKSQALNIWEAVSFSDELGMPLNRFVTILWEQANIVGRVGDVQAQFFERMRKWLQYRGADVAWVWVIENGSEMGLHSHILVHVSGEDLKAWKRMLPKWIDGDVDRRTVRATTITYPVNEETRLNRVRGATRYILKGIENQKVPVLGIKSSKQWGVMGKRAGTSQNIGPASRRNFSNRSEVCDDANAAALSGQNFLNGGFVSRPDRSSAIREFPAIPEHLRRRSAVGEF